jgi:AraC-like DNA-binding protein
MEKAKSLLREQKDLPLAEVAWQCGYQDYNYFFTVVNLPRLEVTCFLCRFRRLDCMTADTPEI